MLQTVVERCKIGLRKDGEPGSNREPLQRRHHPPIEIELAEHALPPLRRNLRKIRLQGASDLDNQFTRSFLHGQQGRHETPTELMRRGLRQDGVTTYATHVRDEVTLS